MDRKAGEGKAEGTHALQMGVEGMEDDTRVLRTEVEGTEEGTHAS